MTRRTVMARVVSVVGLVSLAAGCGSPAGPDHSEESDDGGVGAWSAVAPMPVSLNHLYAVVDGEQVYVTGERRVELATPVLAYSTSTDAWQRLPNPPPELFRPSLALRGDTLLLLGGVYAGAEREPSDKVWGWTPGATAWSETSPLPVASMSHDAAASPGGIVVWGLRDPGQVRADSSLFLPSGASTWLWVQPAPGGIGLVRGAVPDAGGGLWIYGISGVTTFIPDQRAWTPTRRAPHLNAIVAAWLTPSREYVLESDGTVVRHSFREIAGGDWMEAMLPPNAEAWEFAATAAVGERLYLMGGKIGDVPTTRVEVFTAN